MNNMFVFAENKEGGPLHTVAKNLKVQESTHSINIGSLSDTRDNEIQIAESIIRRITFQDRRKNI